MTISAERDVYFIIKNGFVIQNELAVSSKNSGLFVRNIRFHNFVIYILRSKTESAH